MTINFHLPAGGAKALTAGVAFGPQQQLSGAGKLVSPSFSPFYGEKVAPRSGVG